MLDYTWFCLDGGGGKESQELLGVSGRFCPGAKEPRWYVCVLLGGDCYHIHSIFIL